MLHRITLYWSVGSTEPMDIDQCSKTEVRELERKLGPDDAMAEVLVELAINETKQKSDWKEKCMSI